MIKIENVETMNWRAAIRGMRNPLESWDKSDSYFLNYETDFFETINGKLDGCWDNSSPFIIGEADLKLMKSLVNAGTDHSKFMRMITVSYDIVAPLYWWKEFDTYKIGTVRNSCSTMHKIEARELVYGDFATDGLTSLDMLHLQDDIRYINMLINDYKQASGEHKLSIHRRIVKLLPDSYLQRATITTNYQVLRNIRNSDRKTHKLLEWQEDFMKFIDSLPYAKELLIEDEEFKYNKALEFIKSYKLKHNYTMTREEIENYNKEENKCNKEHCEGCESFIYTSSPIHPNKLHIRCNKTNHFGIVDLGHTVKPEDFYEED